MQLKHNVSPCSYKNGLFVGKDEKNVWGRGELGCWSPHWSSADAQSCQPCVLIINLTGRNGTGKGGWGGGGEGTHRSYWKNANLYPTGRMLISTKMDWTRPHMGLEQDLDQLRHEIWERILCARAHTHTHTRARTYTHTHRPFCHLRAHVKHPTATVLVHF